MPADRRLRVEQRREIKPLIDELNRLFGKRSHANIAQDTGMKAYQIGRILGESLPSPTYLDLTRLVVAANLSPNEAAALVGLYPEQPEREAGGLALSSQERRMVSRLRDVRLSPRQEALFFNLMESALGAIYSDRELLEPEEEKEEKEEEAPKTRLSGKVEDLDFETEVEKQLVESPAPMKTPPKRRRVG